MKLDEKLTVSVAVITKDRPELIRQLFESLTRQTLPPDEVVVVDNNSRASYDRVFQEYAGRLPLRTFVEREPGIAVARNRAVRESHGDLLLFTDDDCVADPRWVERIVEPFYRDPQIGAVGGEITYSGRKATIVERYYQADRDAVKP